MTTVPQISSPRHLACAYSAKRHSGPCARAWRNLAHALIAGFLLFDLTAFAGVIPAAERVLPPDTLAFVTAPDFRNLSNAWIRTAPAQFLADTNMAPLRSNLVAKLGLELLGPLERELGLSFSDFSELLNGQVTLAVTDGTSSTPTNSTSPGWLLLIDSGSNTTELKQALEGLRNKCQQAGRSLRTEKVAGKDVSVLSLSTNGLPGVLENLLSGNSTPKQRTRELWVGNMGSVFLATSGAKQFEEAFIRLRGDSGPTLADVPEYRSSHDTIFQGSVCHGWIKMAPVLHALAMRLSGQSEGSQDLADIPPAKVLSALGLSGVASLAFALQETEPGARLRLFIGAPETTRTGLIKILAGQPGEAGIPQFVPADALKFRRFRVDAQKAWATTEEMLAKISPQFASVVNFVLDSANTYARQKEPEFEIRKRLIGNLGNDLIAYEKATAVSAPTGITTSELVLIGSTNATELASGLKSILVFVSEQASSPPQEQEFLGRKIYSVPLSASAYTIGFAKPSGPLPTLHYGAGGGYLALSTDLGLVQEYLRGCDGQTNSLREVEEIRKATKDLGTAPLSLFGYENVRESIRLKFESVRSQGSNALPSAINPPAATALNKMVASATGGFNRWVDPGLMPPFDSVSKYFSSILYAGAATRDGLTFTLFLPAPQLPSKTNPTWRIRPRINFFRCTSG